MKDPGASVRARLLDLARMEGSDFQQVLVRYALERLLYRLGESAHRDRFVLKGALLFALWYDTPHRSTRDADLLGFGPSDIASIAEAFRDIASVEGGDAIVFDPGSIRVQEIHRNAGYSGVRVLMVATLANARCTTRIDIGFGDAVTPAPAPALYPVLLEDLAPPRLRTYPVYTVASEKLHAIASLGMANTRLKDYHDLYVLLARESLDCETLAEAIAATFSRRGMRVPPSPPLGLTPDFSTDRTRRAMWGAFLRKNTLPGIELAEVVTAIHTRIEAAWELAASLQKTPRPNPVFQAEG